MMAVSFSIRCFRWGKPSGEHPWFSNGLVARQLWSRWGKPSGNPSKPHERLGRFLPDCGTLDVSVGLVPTGRQLSSYQRNAPKRGSPSGLAPAEATTEWLQPALNRATIISPNVPTLPVMVCPRLTLSSWNCIDSRRACMFRSALECFDVWAAIYGSRTPQSLLPLGQAQRRASLVF